MAYILNLSILNKKVHYLYVVLGITLLFLGLYNFTFWHKAYVIPILQSDLSYLFKLLAPLAIIALLNGLFILLFSYRYILKAVFIILFLCSSVVTYSIETFGIMYDRAMMQNFIETDTAEAYAYLNPYSILYFLVLGVVPSIILYKIKIYYPRPLKSMLHRVVALVLSLGLAGIIALSYYQQFAFVGRQHHGILNYAVPSNYIASIINYIKDHKLNPPLEFRQQGLNAAVASTTSKPKLTFLVLGETARAANYSALGYSRPTNQFTDRERVNMFNFTNVFACGTATAISVPCMFSNLTRDNYSDRIAKSQDSILDVLQRAKINVTWINNNSGCKGVCDRVPTINIDASAKENSKYCAKGKCFDEVLLSNAQDLVAKARARLEQNQDSKKIEDIFIVFHVIGSHGPKYYERYPDQFKIYTPDCNRADVENCTIEEVTNAYDNSIAYTDWVNYQLIQILKRNADKFTTSFIYISDHGESLGENGIFLHGMPYAIAPDVQKIVPMQLWLPTDTTQEMKIDRKCLLAKTKNGNISHDNLFHSLLGLMQVKSDEYEQELDIFASCIKLEESK